MNWVVLGQVVWYGVVNGMIYVVFASGLTLVFGVLRLLNLAHGELFMLGAMAAYCAMSYLGMSFFLAAVFSVVLIGALGVICYRLAVHPVRAVSPYSVLLATMALSFILRNAAVLIWGAYPRRLAMPFVGVFDLGGVRVSQESIALVVTGAITYLLCYLLLTKTRFGGRIRATQQNIIGARLVGINIARVYDYTWIISAGLAAVAGILIAPILFAFPHMGEGVLIKGFVVIIVAGMGNLPGALAVGVPLGIAEALFGQYVSTYYREVFIYGAMVVLLLLKPEGLFGER